MWCIDPSALCPCQGFCICVKVDIWILCWFSYCLTCYSMHWTLLWETHAFFLFSFFFFFRVRTQSTRVPLRLWSIPNTKANDGHPGLQEHCQQALEKMTLYRYLVAWEERVVEPPVCPPSLGMCGTAHSMFFMRGTCARSDSMCITSLQYYNNLATASVFLF